MSGREGTAEERLARFREDNPGTPIVADDSGLVAFPWGGRVHGADVDDLLGKLADREQEQQHGC